MKNIKLIQINTVCNESTGKIMLSIQRAADQEGFKTLSLFGRRKPANDLNTRKVGDPVSFWTHVALTTAFDLHGRGSVIQTLRMIRILRDESPDIIHLHNIHGYYLNYPILFQYLKEEFHGKVYWTLHDCWAFTGHCAYYVQKQCDKWKTGCYHCENKRQYPVSLFLDRSRWNYVSKKEWFCNVPNLTLLVPSQWLREQVSQSFLKDYETIVVPNGIRLDIFRKENSVTREEILERYHLPADKKIVLGVASHWSEGKGIHEFEGLSAVLPEEYVILLVGGGLEHIPLKNNIYTINRTENVRELVSVYCAADVFLNTSSEDTFSKQTLEAMACGLPVIALDNSAVQELVADECGVVLHDPEAVDYVNAIAKIEEKTEAGIITSESLRRKADDFAQERQTQSIIKLYNNSLN